MSKFVSPSDVVPMIKYDQARQEDIKKALFNEEQQTILRAERLQKYIYDNANPSPVLVICIVIGVIFLIWLLYILFLKPSLTGEWYDEKDRKYILCHSKITGDLSVNGSTKGVCVNGNFVKIGDQIGVWNYGNIIMFVNGGGLIRVV